MSPLGPVAPVGTTTITFPPIGIAPPPVPLRRSLFPFVCAGAAVAGLLAALALGNSARGSANVVVPGSSPAVVTLGVALAVLLARVASVLAVGWLLVPALLLPAPPAWAVHGPRCLRHSARAAWLWVSASLAALLLGVVDGVGGSWREALRPSVVLTYVNEVRQGRFLLYAALLAVAVALLLPGTRGRRPAQGLLAVSLLALLLPVVGGHAGHSHGHRLLAVTSSALHVTAMSLWIGGLLALFVLARTDAATVRHALPRFSVLAALCYATVGASGVLLAVSRVGDVVTLLQTGYGHVVMLKTSLFLVLGWLGYLQRTRVIRPLLDRGSMGNFSRLAACEVLVMLVTVAVAVGLGRTPPP